jgi:hypothetical protein
MFLRKHWTLLLPALLIGLGCSKENSEAPHVSAGTEPPGAKNVLQVRQQAKDGDEVVIVGRVGGSTKPIADGMIVFTIVDASFQPCNEKTMDSCPTPWDYCCDPKEKLAQATAAIQVVDEQGNTIAKDARQVLGIKELATVVVRGKAKRDDKGNLTVVAEPKQVYVRK